MSKVRLKIVLTDSHYKTIYESVRNGCSSCRVIKHEQGKTVEIMRHFVAFSTVKCQQLLPPANIVCKGYVFRFISVHRRGAIPACIAGGIPACLAAGGVSSWGVSSLGSPPGGGFSSWQVPGPGGRCLVLGGGCGLLLWPSGLVPSVKGSLLVWASGGGQKAITEGHHTRRPPQKGVPGEDPTPHPTPDGYCCKRNASYWNAFLLYLSLFSRWSHYDLSDGRNLGRKDSQRHHDF